MCLVVVRDIVEEGQKQDRDRSAEIEQAPGLGMVEGLLRLSDVTPLVVVRAGRAGLVQRYALGYPCIHADSVYLLPPLTMACSR